MPLLGIVYIALEMTWGAIGFLRICMVAVLAYGIARHQLLTAVPIPTGIPPTPNEAGRREEVFLKAARLALRGGPSRDEEVPLAEFAEELGIGAGRAASRVREAERERARQASPDVA